MMNLQQAQQMIPHSVLIGGAPETRIHRVHTDTRTLQAGDLFVALRGERFDAHTFLPQARAAGASACIAEHSIEASGLPGLCVADTRQALADLAQHWRAHCIALQLCAVTGSNGKTTVTQMIATILRAWVGAAAHATEGNFNNEVGVPLTLLRLRAEHRCSVVELGMNHPGEIAALAALAAPTVALVNNAQREHQEFMSSVAAVAKENGAVIEALDAQGCAVFPADDAYSDVWHQLAGQRKILRFSDQLPEAEVYGQAAWHSQYWAIDLRTPQGSAGFKLYVAGQHNVRNALAAAAAALAMGCPLSTISQGLEQFAAVKGRSQVQTLRRAGRVMTLVDDTYNANPDSVRAAIDMLVALPGPHWLLLGDMAEVGNQGPAFHAEIGAYARERGVAAFWSAGELCAYAAAAYGAHAVHRSSTAELALALQQDQVACPPALAILVKGSRFMKMEQVVAALQSGASHAT